MLWDFLATNPTYCKSSLVREFQVNHVLVNLHAYRTWLGLFGPLLQLEITVIVLFDTIGLSYILMNTRKKLTKVVIGRVQS